MLVERGEILEQLDDLLFQSVDGRGRVAVISGLPTMGKSALLNAVVERAVMAKRTVLSAVSSPNGRRTPYSTLVQLLHSTNTLMFRKDTLMFRKEPARDSPGIEVPQRGWQDRAPDTPASALASPAPCDHPLSVAQHLHRLIVDHTAHHHLVITVDDVQHTDEATLRCLYHLAQRLAQLPLSLVLTHRTPINEPSPVLEDLLYRTNVRRFHLGPLSYAAIRESVAHHAPALLSDEAIAAEIRTLSGGNPLLVPSLIEGHRLTLLETRPGPAPTSDVPPASTPNPEEGLAASPVFHQAVLACLHRLGSASVRLARCVALLAEATTPLLVSRLSGIEGELVKRHLSLLASVGLLDGPLLRSASVRQAVLAEMPHDEAAELRARAARLLYDTGAPYRAVAAHLLGIDPLHEDWVVPVLQEAAHQALIDGDPGQSSRYLALARESCQDETERLLVKARYAAAQWQFRPAHSAQHFLNLKQPALEGRLAAADALQVAEGMMFHLDFDNALEIIDRVNNGDQGPVSALNGTRLYLASEFLGLLDRPRRPLPTTGLSATSSSDLRARQALAHTLERGADAHAIAAAEQVLQGCQAPSAWQLKGQLAALTALCYADQPCSAARWFDALEPKVHTYAESAWQGLLQCTGAHLSLRRGQLADAARLAQAAHDRLSGPRWNISGALAVAILVESHTSMGNYQAAAAYLAPEPPPELFLTLSGLHYLYARGRHRLETGSARMALSDFLECGALMRRWKIDTPTVVPWRLGEAEARLRLGERGRAARAVEAQLAMSDAELTRSRGKALHLSALVQPAPEQPAALQEAFAVLNAVGARDAAAAVLADLSRAYYGLGMTTQARQTARRAWLLAKSCGAEARYRPQLPTSVPRRLVGAADAAGLKGSKGSEEGVAQGAFGGLSASEQRVAALATQGYANREIADKLFITVSTVEQHLTRVYRKMRVRNRAQLVETVGFQTT
ncbi:AAA family ATPase [Streptomyces sp. G45]|uniref:AAA family ATPase n=1 Tax=Streptomyces sp. G45 TaxID=3406627 RepID=UPI003C1F95C0